MAKSADKPRSKGKGIPGQVYSSTNYRISEKDERLLRHAAIYLETIGETIHTPQQMIEYAVSKYVEHLDTKHPKLFPTYLLAKKKLNEKLEGKPNEELEEKSESSSSQSD